MSRWDHSSPRTPANENLIGTAFIRPGDTRSRPIAPLSFQRATTNGDQRGATIGCLASGQKQASTALFSVRECMDLRVAPQREWPIACFCCSPFVLQLPSGALLCWDRLSACQSMSGPRMRPDSMSRPAVTIVSEDHTRAGYPTSSSSMLRASDCFG